MHGETLKLTKTFFFWFNSRNDLCECHKNHISSESNEMHKHASENFDIHTSFQ